jgi:hypothetical protein
MIIRSNDAIIIGICIAVFDTNEDCIVVSSLSSSVVVIAGITTGLSTTSSVASHCDDNELHSLARGRRNNGILKNH